jgi:L-iditol 2-dehydrogenase
MKVELFYDIFIHGLLSTGLYMKAVFPKGKRRVFVDEMPPPQVGDRDVILKMQVCGLCGSDLEKVYGNYGMFSGRLGHEPSGEILDVGRSVSGFAAGDRVFVHHHVPCYSCHYCRHGDYTMCQMFHASNIEPCGLSEQILVPEWNISRGGLIKLPPTMTFEKASLIEPLACCIRALNKCRIQKGDDMAIFGAGPAGIMHVLLAQSLGVAKIFLIDVNEFRLKFAKKYTDVNVLNIKNEINIKKIINERTCNRGVDLSVVATSSPKALLQSFETTRKGGKVLVFGVPSKDTQISYDASMLYSNEFSLIPSYGASEIETNQALKLIDKKRINIDWLITHRFNLEHAEDAFRCAFDAKDAMKVIVTGF